MWRAALSVVLFVSFGGFLGWSIVAVVTQGRVVVAVACMCASLVGSFGMLVCYLARPGQGPGPVTRRIEVRHIAKDKEARSPRVRSVVVSETAVVCVAVECGSSPRSSPGMWVFDAESPCTTEPS
jgi:hypothetical protein